MKTKEILFRFHSNLFDEEITEAITCEVIDLDSGIYRVHGVPFYAPMVAPDDLIHATFNADEGTTTYEQTTEHSGSSVVQIVKLDAETDMMEIIQLFKEKSCRIERYTENYFAMEVHYDQDYAPVKEKFEALENEQIASYAEPTLSEKHIEDCQEGI